MSSGGYSRKTHWKRSNDAVELKKGKTLKTEYQPGRHAQMNTHKHTYTSTTVNNPQAKEETFRKLRTSTLQP